MINLDDLSIFKGVDYSGLISDIKVVNFAKNEYMLKEHLDNSNFYYLIEGKVSLYSNTIHGKKKIYVTLDCDNMINDADLNSNSFPYSVRCFEKAKVMVINKAALKQECSENVPLLMNLLALQVKRSHKLYSQLKHSVSISIEKKLAAKLWEISMEYGVEEDGLQKIDFRINNTYLANLIGCSRESVSKAMHKLIDRELVITKNNRLYIKQDAIYNYYSR